MIAEYLNEYNFEICSDKILRVDLKIQEENEGKVYDGKPNERKS